ncbi:MAG: hypothetical protein EXS30_02755 [Pedosphaera sp.]|nr:hypothetical protein [Pedosphaera sp.]
MRLQCLLSLTLLLDLFNVLPEAFAAESPNQNAPDRATSRRTSVPSPFGGNLPATGATNRSSFHVSSVAQTIHGGIQIPALVVMLESSQFSFLPPRGWNVQPSASEKLIRLVRPESAALIILHIIEDKTSGALPSKVEALRPSVLSRYPGARIVEEFSASGMGQSGPAFDLERPHTNHGRERTRVVFIPFPGGYLDCALTVSADKVGHEYHDLNQLLLSFRRAPLRSRIELQSVTPE